MFHKMRLWNVTTKTLQNSHIDLQAISPVFFLKKTVLNDFIRSSHRSAGELVANEVDFQYLHVFLVIYITDLYTFGTFQKIFVVLSPCERVR